MFILFAWDCACVFLCLGAMKAENMAGRPHSLIPMSALPLLTSAFSPRRSVVSVTLQTSQLSCFFTVKVLTKHERCQYEGPLITVWLAQQSWAYMCARLALERCAWWQLYDSTWGETDGGPNSLTHLGSQQPALYADVSNTLAQAKLCRSKPVNLIPISGSLIMCLPVLAFVTKQNKELEKSWERKPKWKGRRRVKRGPENEARKEKLRDCLEKWSGSKMLQWLEFIFRKKKGYDTVDKPELGCARPCVCLTSGHMFAWLTTPKTLPNAHYRGMQIQTHGQRNHSRSHASLSPFSPCRWRVGI